MFVVRVNGFYKSLVANSARDLPCGNARDSFYKAVFSQVRLDSALNPVWPSICCDSSAHICANMDVTANILCSPIHCASQVCGYLSIMVNIGSFSTVYH